MVAWIDLSAINAQVVQVNMNTDLFDPSAERGVLAGICKYGDECYFDVADILSEDVFVIDTNKILFACISYIFEKDNSAKIDLAYIYSAARELGFSEVLGSKEESLHVKAILDFPVSKDNIRAFSAKIKKLHIARTILESLNSAQYELQNITGSESVGQILSIAENHVLGISNSLNDTNNDPISIGNDIEEYIDHLENSPIQQPGLSTGFPVFDKAIGGGLRKGTVNVIAARPKTGKTLLADNMGYHLANNGIPVLNMDTEMMPEDHINRVMAMVTEIGITDIETGAFAKSQDLRHKIHKAKDHLKTINLFYKSIAGKAFDEQLSIMRRWIMKEVGLNEDGTAKDCVIIYDYLKLMDSQGVSQDMKEYQILGFMMTQLHNFATKFKIPIIAFVQLNRDGITKETTDTASGSDRIIWLCSNFSIFKRKSDEEIAEDGPNNGNRKLIPVVSRHGSGLEDNDYINCHMKGWCAKITEGNTRIEISNGLNNNGFEVQNNEDDASQIPFN